MSDINGNELSAKKFLRLDNLSPAVKNLQYAVRGKIVIRAGELEKELKQVRVFVATSGRQFTAFFKTFIFW